MHMIRHITDPTDPALHQLPPLFIAMHAEMAESGMREQLTDDGANAWLNGSRSGLERFHRISVAELDGRVIGFAQATIKLTPEHLVGTRIGHIAYVHVEREHRRQGIARALADRLQDWFNARAITNVTLEVVHGNKTAQHFWEALGYRPERIILRNP